MMTRWSCCVAAMLTAVLMGACGDDDSDRSVTDGGGRDSDSGARAGGSANGGSGSGGRGGQGGGSDAAVDGGTVTAGMVEGTAARGAPITGASIVLKDRNGTMSSGSTDDQGKFEIAVDGLVPPFLVRVSNQDGPLYTVASDAGVANLHPLTNLVVEVFYEVHGTNADAAFDGLDESSPVPTPIEVKSLEVLFKRMVEKWLQDAGIDPATFDLIATPFDADGNGFDSVLDLITVDGDTVTISDGTTSQTSTISSAISGDVTIQSTVDSGDISTSSRDSTAIPPDDIARALGAAVEARLEDFVATVRDRGASLEDTDILGFVSADFLDDGDSRSVFAASVAGFLRRAMLVDAGIGRVVAYDEASEALEVIMRITAMSGDQRFVAELPMPFALDGSVAVMVGDQRIVRTRNSVQTEMRTDSSSQGEQTYGAINVDIGAPAGLVDAIAISGGPFTSTDVTKSPVTRTSTLEPKPGTMMDYVTDAFFANSGAQSQLPPADTVYTVVVDPAQGANVEYSVRSNGVSGEAISFQASPATHSLSGILGQTLMVSWERPLTYAVSEIQLTGHVSDGQTEVEIGGEMQIDPTATSGMLEFPSTMPGSGNAIVDANFNFSINGPTGERSIVIYMFDEP